MSIYNFKPESVYNFTDMSQEEFTEARREYDYYLQSVLNRPINLDLNKERETVAQEIENENLAALDKTFENSVAANPAILHMYVNAYHGVLPKTKTDPSLSLEDKASGKFVANALVNNPRLFEEWAIGNYDVEANKNSTMNKLYIEQALSNYINNKQGQVTKVDYATNFVEDIALGSIYRTKAEQAFATDVLGKEASFDTDIREEDLLRLINENAEKMESKEFKLWFDEKIINNIDRMDSLYMRGSSVLTTADMDEASDLYKLDMARRLQNGSTSGDQMMFNYGDFKMVYKANEFVYDMAESAIKGSKSKKTLKLQKLVNDDAGATKTAEELAEAGDNATVAHESNYSATVGTAVTSVPVIVDRPRVLANEVPHPTDVTPYEYKFYEKDYIEKNMYDNDNVINMYRDDQGMWTTDTPDNTIRLGQDAEPLQLEYTNDGIVFTENPAPGYTRVVYGTGSDGKQAYTSFEKAERDAYDRMIDTAKDDGNVVVMAAARVDYNKPSFKAMGTGEGNNAYAEGDALYYSVIEKGNDWIAARDRYLKRFEREFWLNDSEINRFKSRLEKGYKINNIDIEQDADFFLDRYLYHFVKNDYNHAKAFKKARNEFYKAKRYFKQHPDDNDTRIAGFYNGHFKTGPVVNKETGEVFDSIMEAYIEMDAEDILKRNPAPVLKTFVIPKKYYDKLVNEQGMTPAQAMEMYHKNTINKAYGTDFVPSYDKEMNETLGKFMKKYGFEDYRQLQKRFSGSIEYTDIYNYVQADVELRLEKEAQKLNNDAGFLTGQTEKIIEAKYRKPYDKVVQERTLKELHRLGIYGSRHAKTNIALNTTDIQKTVATTRLSEKLDGTFQDKYNIKNSKYWYTPVNINGRWYIQNTIRWNDKPIKMFKDGTIMEL